MQAISPTEGTILAIQADMVINCLLKCSLCKANLGPAELAHPVGARRALLSCARSALSASEAKGPRLSRAGVQAGSQAPRASLLQSNTTNLFLPRASFCIEWEQQHKTEYLVHRIPDDLSSSTAVQVHCSSSTTIQVVHSKVLVMAEREEEKEWKEAAKLL